MNARGNAAGRVARAAGLVMVLFVLSRATGLLRQVVIGAQFGTSPEYDAYVAAFRLPDMLFQLVAGGALVSALLPTYTTVRARQGAPRAWELVSTVVTWVLVVLTLAAVGVALAADPLVRHVLVPDFSPTQQGLTAALLRILLLSTVIFGLSGIAMSVLNAHHHFLLPALAPTLYNLGIIGGALFLAPFWGIYGLAWGVVIGAAMHLGIQVPALYRLGLRYRPRLDWRDPAVRHVVTLMVPRVIGLAAVQVNFLVNTMLASGLPAGRLSALDYGFRMMLLPLGIFAQAVATAAFPTLADQAARQAQSAMRDTLQRLVHNILLLTLPATVFLILLAHPLIALLFQRQAFDALSTQLTAAALQAYAVGLCGHALVEILARAFYASHDTRTPVAVGVAAMGLNIALNFWWVHVWQHVGLALANSVATLLEATVLLVVLNRRGLFELKAFAAAVRLQLLATAAMTSLILAMRNWFWPTSSWGQLASGLFLGGAVYFFLAWRFQLWHTEELLPWLARRR